jgi:saccharopine dehydrogenase-like NADP-dependent oxidoreductase
LARHAADQLDQVDEVHIAFASYRAIAPSPGLLDTVLDEFSPGSRRFFWRQGEFVEVPAFSGAKRVAFADPVGEIETYYVPHSETHTIHRFIGKGVQVVDVRGTWHSEIMQALRLFAALELTSDKKTQINGELVSAKQFLRAHILEHAAAFGSGGGCAFFLNVQVEGFQNGKRVQFEYKTRHPLTSDWGSSSTAKMTGIPASIAAQKLAKGAALRKGVMSPEACFDPQFFFDELAKRQIFVEAYRRSSES